MDDVFGFKLVGCHMNQEPIQLKLVDLIEDAGINSDIILRQEPIITRLTHQ